MIDTLVQHLLEEIAMDGQAGTTVSRLSSFVKDFHSTKADSNGSQASTSTASAKQNVDPTYLSFVWDTLLGQDEVLVGALTALEGEGEQEDEEAKKEESVAPFEGAGEGEQEAGEAAATAATAGNADGEEDAKEDSPGPSTAAKGKGKSPAVPKKRKKKARDVGRTGHTHTLVVLDDEKRSWSREQLVQEYGADLRIAVDSETAWAAITGSSMRPSSLTAPVYSVLEHVSRGRGDGSTVVGIGRDLGIDQKSAFHYVRVLVNLGIVKKFRTIAEGCWTNRILHVRYLSVSPHWKVFMSSDATASDRVADAAAARADQDDDEDEDPAGQVAAPRMGAIGRNHLRTNPALVQGRIIRVLKSKDQHFMAQRQIASQVGLFSYNRNDLRRLNQIIVQMCNEGIIEKMMVNEGVKKKNKNEREPRLVQCLRLLPQEAGSDDESKEQEPEMEDDDSPHSLTLVAIERQIIDLLVEADAEGMTHLDLSYALGGIPNRSIDQILARLSRSVSLPPHLRDLTLHLVTEIVGRQKRSRWFTLVGYLRRCERDGAMDAVRDLVPRIGSEEDGVGGWYDITKEPKGGFYRDARDRYEATKSIDVKKGGKFKNGGLGVRQRDDPWIHVSSVKVARKRGRPSNANLADGDGGDSPAPAKVKATPKVKSTPKDKPPPKAKREPKPKKVKGADKQQQDDLASPSAEPEPEPDSDRDSSAGPSSTPAASGKKKERKPKHEKKPMFEPGPDGMLVQQGKGRPRKKPLPPGKLTYYERRKREDAERIAMGLEPRKKGERLPANKKKKVKAVESDSDEEGKKDELNEDSGMDLDSPQPKPEPKPKRTTRKSAAAVDPPPPASEPDEQEDVDISDAAPPTPKPSASSNLPRTRTAIAAAAAIADAAAAATTPASKAKPVGKGKGKEKEKEDDETLPSPAGATRGRPLRSGAAATPAPAPKPTPAPRSTRKRPRDPEGENEEELAPTSLAQSKEVVAPPPSSSAASPAPKRPKKKVEVYLDLQLKQTPSRKGATLAATKTAPSSTPAVSKENAEAETEAQASSSQVAAAAAVAAITTAIEEQADSAPASGATSPAPTATPLHPRARQLAGSSQPRPSSNRTSTPGKATMNHSFFAKQNEVLDFLKHESVGGVVEYTIQFPVVVRALYEKHFPTKNGARYLMDNRSSKEVVNALIERKIVRKTVASTPTGRIEFLSLISIPLDDPRITNAITAASDRRAGAPIRGKRLELPLAEDLTLGDGIAPRELGILQEPSAEDESGVVRNYFRRIPGVVGAQFGALYGRVARARHLHKWLLEWVESAEDGDKLISTSPNVVFDQSIITSRLPFGDYLRIITLPIDEPELDAFVADEDNLTIPLASLPRRILNIVKPTIALRQRALWPCIETLINLHILTPLVASLRENTSEAIDRTYVPPNRPDAATHYQLSTAAPFYSFSQKDRPLVAVMDVSTPEKGAEYWTKLHAESFPSNAPRSLVLDEAEAQGFPLAFDGHSSFAGRIMTSTTKWHDSYMLLLSQRRYLARLANFNKELVDDETALRNVARDTLAPKDVVERYLRHVLSLAEAVKRHKRRKAQQKEGGAKVKRTRKRCKVAAAEGEEQEAGADATGDEGAWQDDDSGAGNGSAPVLRVPSTRRKTAKQKKKPTDAVTQRENAFTAIIERFKNEHGQLDIDSQILDYLKKRFCYAKRGLIDAKQLESELLLQVPDGDVPGYKTIVPAAIRRRVQQGFDPYSLPAGPAFKSKKNGRLAAARQKANSLVNKQKEAAPVVEEQAGSDDEVAAAPVQEDEEPPRMQEIGAEVEGEGWWPSLTSNAQNEFLSEPARPVPVLKDKQRLPRNFFSAEQDELLRDAAAVLKARAEHVERRIVWTPLAQLFSELTPNKMRQHFKRISESREDSVYQDRLVEAWHVEWRKKRGSAELPDDYPQDQTRFDLAAFVRCLRATVDKRALRLSGPRAEAAPAARAGPVIKLPATLDEFGKKFVVDERLSGKPEALRWDGYLRANLSGATREAEAAAGPFATVCSSEEGPVQDRQLLLTVEALKMLHATPPENYVADHGDLFLQAFEEHLPSGIKELLDTFVLTKKNRETTRRGPGRGHAFSDRFTSSFAELIDPSKALAASQKEHELLSEEGTSEWSLFAEGGEMMALVRLASEGKVSMTVETSVSAMFRDPSDYQTRQKDDEAYECSVLISPAQPVDRAPARRTAPRFPLPFPREGTSSDTFILAEACAKLKDLDDEPATTARKALDFIRNAGVGGLSFNALAARFPTVDHHSLKASVDILVSFSPPLVFWAGDNTVSLVACEFLDSWTVAVHPPSTVPPRRHDQSELPGEDEPQVTTDDLRTRVFPAPWLDLYGDVIPGRWEESVGWIKGLLLSHSGSTTHQLYARTRAIHLLTLHQILMVLETLESWQVVQRKSVESVVSGMEREQDKDLPWGEARWYLCGSWYSL